jgi:cytochrome c553
LNRSLTMGLALAALAFAGAVQAGGDAEAGKLKAFTCMGCHGIPGLQNAYPSFRVPKLGGQHPEYLIAALQAYRGGLRAHPAMNAQAADLSDEDMADIAEYYGRHRGN